MNKLQKIIAAVGVLVLVIGILAGFALKPATKLGGLIHTLQEDFTKGIRVAGTEVINSSGVYTGAVTSTGAISGTTGTYTGDITSSDGRLVYGTETGGTCSTGLAIDLSTVAKGIVTTIGETNTACAISFTNGTAGEVVLLSHNYTGTGVITFADVTGFDAAWTPVAATCSGIDAGVTAANDDHFYLIGAMTSATEIMITGCQYFNAA